MPLPLPLTLCCFSKIQIGFTFLALAHLGSLRQRAVKWVCVLKIVTFLSFAIICQEVVREDCQARKLNKEDAMDRCKWRKMIKEAR